MLSTVTRLITSGQTAKLLRHGEILPDSPVTLVLGQPLSWIARTSSQVPGHSTWEFPKIGGTLSWGPYSKDPTISGAILGPPLFGNMALAMQSMECPQEFLRRNSAHTGRQTFRRIESRDVGIRGGV